ncbi:Vacuolar protein sorting-associated protein 8 [Phlyctochytrium bullatum]|nr:Vacuolar protein sorting-associated protein 8 [Phlyctochytrium bullatum]
MALSSYGTDGEPSDRASLQGVLKLCISASLDIGVDDFLFVEIFDKFTDYGLQGVFFETLEPFILADMVQQLANPTLVHELINYFRENGWLERIEQIILHLDPFSLDLHGTIQLSREYGLMSALIYLYTRSLHDFVSPLIELLRLIEEVQKGVEIRAGTISVASRCYTLFVYLAYTLTGNAFPIGTLSRKEALRAKTDIYNFLFSENYLPWPPEDPSRKPVQIGEPSLPYLRLLLSYDAREFLRVILLAFEDNSLNGEIRVRSASASEGRVRFADEHTEFSRQYIVESLISASGLNESRTGIREDISLQLNIFLAQAVARFQKDVHLSAEDLDTIITGISDIEDGMFLSEREFALRELFLIYTPSKDNISSEEYATRFEERKLWRVAELLHTMAQRYDRVLRCYLNDLRRGTESFRCFRDLLLKESLTYAQIWAVKQEFLSSISSFIQLDPAQTAYVVLDLLPGDLNDIIQKLDEEPHAQFQFLSHVLDDNREAKKPSGLQVNLDVDTKRKRRYPNHLYERLIELTSLSETFDEDPYSFDKILNVEKLALTEFENKDDPSRFLEAIEQLYNKFNQFPSASQIYAVLKPEPDVDEDRIDMNDDNTFIVEIDKRKAGSGLGSNRITVTKAKFGRVSWIKVGQTDEFTRAVIVEDEVTKKSNGWALELEFLSSGNGAMIGGGSGGYLRIRTAETLALGDDNKGKLTEVAEKIHTFLDIKKNPFEGDVDKLESRISSRGQERRAKKTGAESKAKKGNK